MVCDNLIKMTWHCSLFTLTKSRYVVSLFVIYICTARDIIARICLFSILDFERLTQRNDETRGFLYTDILKGILTTNHSLQNILLSKFTPFIISFWDKTSLNSNLFEKSWGWLTDLVFLENKISCSCLFFSGFTQFFIDIPNLLRASSHYWVLKQNYPHNQQWRITKYTQQRFDFRLKPLL